LIFLTGFCKPTQNRTGYFRALLKRLQNSISQNQHDLAATAPHLGGTRRGPKSDNEDNLPFAFTLPK
jgi:hypothetical protein